MANLKGLAAALRAEKLGAHLDGTSVTNNLKHMLQSHGFDNSNIQELQSAMRTMGNPSATAEHTELHKALATFYQNHRTHSANPMLELYNAAGIPRTERAAFAKTLRDYQAPAPQKAAAAARNTAEADSPDTSVSSAISDLKIAKHNNGLSKEEFIALETALKRNKLIVPGSRKNFPEGASKSDLTPDKALKELEAGRPISSDEFSRIKSASKNSELTKDQTTPPTAFVDKIGASINAALRAPQAVGNFFGAPARWHGTFSTPVMGRALGTTALIGIGLAQPFVDVIPGELDPQIDRGPAQIELAFKYGYGLLSGDYKRQLVSEYKSGQDTGPVNTVLFKKFSEIDLEKTKVIKELEGAEQGTAEADLSNASIQAQISTAMAAANRSTDCLTPSDLKKRLGMLGNPAVTDFNADQISTFDRLWKETSGSDSCLSKQEQIDLRQAIAGLNGDDFTPDAKSMATDVLLAPPTLK